MEGTALTVVNSDIVDELEADINSQNSFDCSVSVRNTTRTYNRWSPLEEGITLAWNDVSVSTKIKSNGKFIHKRIINGVSGAVKPGTLVALMGASGAGKSTLMSALAYRQSGTTEIEGDILINGRPIGSYLKYLSGYMHQEDLFVPTLTILEHMTVMANLKLDRRISKADKEKKIRSILKDLGLLDCLNTIIGGIGQSKALSGGEKKRLAFATELLTDPPILFCDEPTTGLDSYSAHTIVTIMNQMACCGNTILCTIHQPTSDIFAMFTQLILMAEGMIIYMGSTAGALDFFQTQGYTCPSSYNPADFLIKAIATTPGSEESSKQTIRRICHHFAISDYAKEVDVVVQYEFHMGRAPRKFELRKDFKEVFWWSKLYWLIYRWTLEAWRNPSIQTVRVLQRVGVAVIIGLCYLGTNAYTQSGIQSVEGIIFIFVSENTFNPMYAVLSEFPEDTAIFLREYRSGLYNSFTYYLSRILSLLPGFIIEPILFAVIAYWLSGLRPSVDAFFYTVLITILTANVASACGIMFSNVWNSVPTAMAYLVPFDYILMVTSGLFIKLSTLPSVVNWTKYLSWLMYAMESLSIIQWRDVSNITCENEKLDLPCIRNGTEVLEKYDFSEDHFVRDIWAMIVLLICFHTIGYIFLWWKTKSR
ncbi:hypothetical protein NQ315_011404 [Exocentrus adspersus]|uniref:ABC transporter domain-containing protein n=1 Tax=Exocentrus adspersus TaxID=1586481 RepID=A0AAV8VJR2_9CUCU|nr:hypothetical protein NQ315_011404 [Exocentrus adspersus]